MDELNVSQQMDESITANMQIEVQQLWMDFLIWNRHHIISGKAKLDDTPFVISKTYESEEKIGGFLALHYPENDADNVIRILKQYTQIISDVIATAGVTELMKTGLAANSDDFTKQLEKMNPFWNVSVMQPVWNDHLKFMIQQCVARMEHKWSEDIQAFENDNRTITEFANRFSHNLMYHINEKNSAQKQEVQNG